jgi:ubiquinone/menaquinone biosynthesis C-methylase UbiE
MTDYLAREPIDLEAPGVASLLDELSFWSSRFGILLFEHFDFSNCRRVLDIGCGNGFPLFELAHALGRASRVTGVDTWRSALGRAAFKRQRHETPNVDLVLADASGLPFRDGSFDRIVSNLGINNFADPRRVLLECHRALQVGGTLTFTTNVRGHMREFYAVFRDVLAETGDSLSLERLAANENHRSSPAEIDAMLSDAGFRTTKVVEEQFTMRYADGSALLRHPLTRIGFLDGWRAVVSQENEKAVFNRLEERLNAMAGEGGLRLTVPMLYIEGRKAG